MHCGLRRRKHLQRSRVSGAAHTNLAPYTYLQAGALHVELDVR